MKNMIWPLLLIATVGCGKWQGTDTGNPFVNHQGQCDAGIGCSSTTNEATGQVNNICGRISLCHPEVQFGSCFRAVGLERGLQNEIDLNIESFADLSDALSRGQVKSVDDRLRTCNQSIIDLTCDSGPMKEAFSGDDLTNYSQIHKILRAHADCRSAYTL